VTLTFLIIFLLLIFSAIFSGAETAFFSLAKIHIKKLEKENSARSHRILKLLKNPRQLLITVLLGGTLADITSTTLATIYVIKLTPDFTTSQISLAMAALVVGMTTLLLIFGEVIPKLIAFSIPAKFASFSSFILIVFRFLTYPVIITLDWLTSTLSKKRDFTKEIHSALSREDIRNIVQSESSNHLLEENERKIIDSIFRFSSTEVREIMVPRVDITGIDISASIAEATKVIVESGYSRIPVYKKTIDDIIGIIYAKDLILYPEKNTIQNVQRKVTFIPENMKIQTLLTLFQNRKKQIAIVVDEYGGTAGIVTLEDILEELVGEIMDEYDDEQPMVTKLSENNYLLSGMLQISEVNRRFNLELPDEFDNLADFLYSELNHIPKKNEKYRYLDIADFLISQIKKQRIFYVKMKILRVEKEGADD
jgi:CBS domain containing-hemolysin-like protein